MERATATATAEGEGEDDTVCLDESFFINDDYQLTTFTFGSQVLQLFCLQSASTDFDLTGQLVWPGATLLNNFLSKNPEMLSRCSVIELGSGVGVTGILCSRFCCEVILTDHNEEVLKILNKNIDLHSSTDNSNGSAGLMVEKLEWGNSVQLDQILKRHPGGFDLSSIPLLFDTVQQLLHIREEGNCKFLLAYVSRAKVMDAMVISEAISHGLQITEIVGSRSVAGNLEGVIFEITLQ
ncbi:hypothetical protein ACSBR2_033635 [Camellia fascicularis]